MYAEYSFRYRAQDAKAQATQNRVHRFASLLLCGCTVNVVILHTQEKSCLPGGAMADQCVPAAEEGTASRQNQANPVERLAPAAICPSRTEQRVPLARRKVDDLFLRMK